MRLFFILCFISPIMGSMYIIHVMEACNKDYYLYIPCDILHNAKYKHVPTNILKLRKLKFNYILKNNKFHIIETICIYIYKRYSQLYNKNATQYIPIQTQI